MGYRTRELDVAHALTSDLRKRHLHTAFLTDHASVLESLVFPTETLIVFDRAKNFSAEQTVSLGFERPVIDRLWLLDLAKGPRPDHLRRSQTDANGIKLI